MDIPNLGFKLEALALTREFEEQLGDIQKNIDGMKHTCEILLQSGSLKKGVS